MWKRVRWLVPLGLFVGIAYVVSVGPIFPPLSDEQRSQLHDILLNANLTRAQIKSGVAEWVEAQNETLQDAYRTYQEEKADWKKLFIEAHNKRVAQLSQKAKDLDSRLMAVWQNETLTVPQTCESIQILINSAPEKIVKEMFSELRKCKLGDPDKLA